MGSVYRRGNIWWVKYYRNGKSYRESSQSSKKEVAKRLLRRREGEISEGKMPGIYYDRVKFDELAEDYLTDYRINQRSTLSKAERCVRYLSEEFGGMKATEITTTRVKRYIEKRLEAGLANATINRELAALKRMFSLAAQCTPPKVARIPYVPTLKENNVRKGFFEYEEFLAIRKELPDYLKPVVTFGYYYGWRKTEILELTWDKVDLKARVVRLDPGETKNDDGRTIYLNEEVFEMLRELKRNRNLGCSYVFSLKGRRIASIHKAWTRACKRAGLKGKIFHDFRRTAVRNMVRAGIPERVAMMISGHRTRTVFDRYNIVNEGDLQEATWKMEDYHGSRLGHNLGTIADNKVIELNQPRG